MKYQQAILLLALCGLVTACDMPDFNYSSKHGKISLTGNVLTLHADGAPDAALASSGDFSVDGKPVAITAPQRGLLMLYYQDVMDIREQSVGMGKAGAAAGLKAIKDKMGGTSNPDANKQIDDDVTAQIHQLMVKMCQDQVNLKTLQEQLVAQLPDFKPYGSMFTHSSVDECVKSDED